MKLLKRIIFDLRKKSKKLIIIFTLISSLLTSADHLLALSQSEGEKLFIQHCSGCHVNGGNIIRRGKSLKISSLKRNGLDDPEKIAKVARLGIGSMSGYEEYLGKGGDQIVANWIWEQAQKAWIQG